MMHKGLEVIEAFKQWLWGCPFWPTHGIKCSKFSKYDIFWLIKYQILVTPIFISGMNPKITWYGSLGWHFEFLLIPFQPTVNQFRSVHMDISWVMLQRSFDQKTILGCGSSLQWCLWWTFNCHYKWTWKWCYASQIDWAWFKLP